MNLTELGQKNFTSKVPYGYLEVYENLWSHMQEDPITLLEIGVYNGNSMRTWCEWFPNATIVGIDHNKNNPMDVGRAQIRFGWQEDPVFLREVADQYDGFDIIIDDGGHIERDQIISYEVLFRYLKPGGMYIIEDLHAERSISMKYLSMLVEEVIGDVPHAQIKSIEFHRSLVVIHHI